jgi:hypothetical protein
MYANERIFCLYFFSQYFCIQFWQFFWRRIRVCTTFSSTANINKHISYLLIKKSSFTFDDLFIEIFIFKYVINIIDWRWNFCSYDVLNKNEHIKNHISCLLNNLFIEIFVFKYVIDKIDWRWDFCLYAILIKKNTSTNTFHVFWTIFLLRFLFSNTSLT